MEAASVVALTCALGCGGASAWHLGCAGSAALGAAVARERAANKGRLLTVAQRLELAEKRVRVLLNRVPQVRDAMQHAKQAHYRQQLRQSLPQAIRLLCIALDSGNSLSKALEYAARNSTGAISRELRHAVWDIQAGQSFAEAMEGLRHRTGGSEFSCLVVAMEIQHRCGGTLGSILESVSQMLQQASDLEDDLITKTTQAQLSARVVALMPIAVLAMLSLVSPGYIGQFFQSAAGVAILVLAVILELIGVVLVRQSLSVDMGMEDA